MVHNSTTPEIEVGCQDNQLYIEKIQTSNSNLNPAPDYNHKRNSHLRQLLSSVPVQSLLFECECCNAQLEDLDQLHRHIKKHKFQIIFRKMSALPPEKAAKILESLFYRNMANQSSLSSKQGADNITSQNWQHCTKRPSDQDQVQPPLAQTNTRTKTTAKPRSQVKSTGISSKSSGVSKTTEDYDFGFSTSPSSNSDSASKTGPASQVASASTEYHSPSPSTPNLENVSRFNLLRGLLDNVNYGNRKRAAGDILNNMEEYQQSPKRITVITAVIKCEVCQESFTQSSDLVNHLLAVHKLQTSQGCRWCAKCGQKFLTVGLLYVHETRGECL